MPETTYLIAVGVGDSKTPTAGTALSPNDEKGT